MRDATRPSSLGWLWFCAWAGPGIVLGLQVSMIGPFLAVPGLLVVWALRRATGFSAEALGLAAGAGATALFIAWLNAGGDGLDARPWAIVGASLAGGAIVAYAGLSRSASASSRLRSARRS